MTELIEPSIPLDTALQLEVGDPIAPFSLPDQRGEAFHTLSDSVAGLPTLLLFDCVKTRGERQFDDVLARVSAALDGSLEGRVLVLGISRRQSQENRIVSERLELPFKLLSDPEGEIYRACGLEPAPPGCEVVGFVLDQQSRIADIMGGNETLAERALRSLRANLDEQRHDTLGAHAPVLLVKRVLTPEDCRRLIQYWHRPVRTWSTDGFVCEGYEVESGDFKVQGEEPYKVLQMVVRDSELQRYLDAKIIRRIKPAVQKAFQTSFSKREEYRIAAYDSASGDHLAAHRDNPTAKTRHRRFTVSVALNAEEFEGGALQFREYGRQEYLVETGSAVVWSCALLHEVLPVTAGRRFILGTHFFGS